MSSFITQCPHCETSFNITQAQLKLAKGKVRCGFCLKTFSALEQQLFIEEELETDENFLEDVNSNVENERDISKDQSKNSEAQAFEVVAETFPEEDPEENIEESLYANSLPESDNEEDEVLEASLPEQNQTDTDLVEDIDEIDGLEELDESDEVEEVEEVEEDLNIDEVIENEVETILEEVIEVTIEDIEDDIEDGNVIDESINEDHEDLNEEDEAEAEEGLEESIDEEIEEQIEETVKEQFLEIETTLISSILTKQDTEQETKQKRDVYRESEADKKKQELQSLEALYDDEALNTDGTNPVNAISEEPIPIYRQYTRPAFITSLLFFSNVLLILAISAQYAWENIDTYLRESRFTALTDFVCNYANCPDVQRFDLSSFSTDELIVNAHPSVPNALQIDFIFSNTAEFDQEFPLVELNFSDLNRRLVANRLFRSEEYLEQGLQQFTHLPANSSIQIRLEIADPGPEAINYSLALRTP